MWYKGDVQSYTKAIVTTSSTPKVGLEEAQSGVFWAWGDPMPRRGVLGVVTDII